MKYEDIVQFLGYSPENEVFDRYLTANNISERPEFDENPYESIRVFELGLCFVCVTKLSYEEHHGPLNFPGQSDQMIFSNLQMYGPRNDSKFAGYADELPFGLKFNATLSNVEKIFGLSTLNHPSGPDNRVHVWYDIEGFTVGINFFLDQSGVSFVSIEKKSLEPPVPFDW